MTNRKAALHTSQYLSFKTLHNGKSDNLPIFVRKYAFILRSVPMVTKGTSKVPDELYVKMENVMDQETKSAVKERIAGV